MDAATPNIAGYVQCAWWLVPAFLFLGGWCLIGCRWLLPNHLILGELNGLLLACCTLWTTNLLMTGAESFVARFCQQTIGQTTQTWVSLNTNPIANDSIIAILICAWLMLFSHLYSRPQQTVATQAEPSDQTPLLAAGWTWFPFFISGILIIYLTNRWEIFCLGICIALWSLPTWSNKVSSQALNQFGKRLFNCWPALFLASPLIGIHLSVLHPIFDKPIGSLFIQVAILVGLLGLCKHFPFAVPKIHTESQPHSLTGQWLIASIACRSLFFTVWQPLVQVETTSTYHPLPLSHSPFWAFALFMASIINLILAALLARPQFQLGTKSSQESSHTLQVASELPTPPGALLTQWFSSWRLQQWATLTLWFGLLAFLSRLAQNQITENTFRQTVSSLLVLFDWWSWYATAAIFFISWAEQYRPADFFIKSQIPSRATESDCAAAGFRWTSKWYLGMLFLLTGWLLALPPSPAYYCHFKLWALLFSTPSLGKLGLLAGCALLWVQAQNLQILSRLGHEWLLPSPKPNSMKPTAPQGTSASESDLAIA